MNPVLGRPVSGLEALDPCLSGLGPGLGLVVGPLPAAFGDPRQCLSRVVSRGRIVVEKEHQDGRERAQANLLEEQSSGDGLEYPSIEPAAGRAGG